MSLSSLNHVKRVNGNRPPAPPQVVLCTFAVDRSGSMESYGIGVIEHTNKLIQEQKDFAVTSDIPTYMTLTTFDDIREDRMCKVKLNTGAIPKLNELKEWLKPRNCTRLLDTAMECVDSLIDFRREYLSRFSRETRGLIQNDNVKMIFAIFTDGFDNTSEFTALDLNRKMKGFESEGGIAMFLAANQDAINTGNQFGFSADRSLTVGVTSKTASSALGCTSALFRCASSGVQDVSYSDAMREESQDTL
jgi:hypothetical protein